MNGIGASSTCPVNILRIRWDFTTPNISDLESRDALKIIFLCDETKNTPDDDSVMTQRHHSVGPLSTLGPTMVSFQQVIL